MQMPRSWSSAIWVRKLRSKRCSRSRSWILGATSLPAQSRTVFSTAFCSSDSSKSIIALPSSRRGRVAPSPARRTRGPPAPRILGFLVSSGRRPPPGPARSTVLPGGLPLLHDRAQAFVDVLGGQELVQVDVLGVPDGVGEGQVEPAHDGPPRELHDGSARFLEALDERSR